eukprot:jgi/Tetstr1/460700/TSEL_005887.t1
MTYPLDHMEEYKGLTWASVKDLAKTFVVRFAFIMGKRLTRNLKIQSRDPRPQLPITRCSSLHHISPLWLDKDQVLTMIQNGRAARAKH